jgi:hypothetical protein
MENDSIHDPYFCFFKTFFGSWRRAANGSAVIAGKRFIAKVGGLHTTAASLQGT